MNTTVLKNTLFNLILGAAEYEQSIDEADEQLESLIKDFVNFVTELKKSNIELDTDQTIDFIVDKILTNGPFQIVTPHRCSICNDPVDGTCSCTLIVHYLLHHNDDKKETPFEKILDNFTKEEVTIKSKHKKSNKK